MDVDNQIVLRSAERIVHELLDEHASRLKVPFIQTACCFVVGGVEGVVRPAMYEPYCGAFRGRFEIDCSVSRMVSGLRNRETGLESEAVFARRGVYGEWRAGGDDLLGFEEGMNRLEGVG